MLTHIRLYAMKGKQENNLSFIKGKQENNLSFIKYLMFLNDRKRFVYTFNLSHYNHNYCKMKYWKYHLNFNSLFSHRPVVHVHESQKQISGIYIYILTIIYKIGIRTEYMAWNQDSFPVHKICNSFIVFYLDQENCSHVTVLKICGLGNCSGFKT